MLYKHTQYAYLILIVIALVLGITCYAFRSMNETMPAALRGVLFIILLVGVSFHSLTVSVDKEYLSLRFGCGLLRKKFLLTSITSVQKVKNSRYYGWGIRLWLWPPMIIYNVSGFDAIELKTKNGKIYRIGTDEPDVLEAIVLQAIQK